MKKVLFIALTAVFVFTGCSFRDLFIDQVEVHTGLVQKMEAVLIAEENFYNEYWSLVDDMDTTLFEGAYNDFAATVEELDDYFAETIFASSQEVFKEEYEDYYVDFIADYVEYAGEFTDLIEDSGYTFEIGEPYFGDLDSYTIEFVSIHDRLEDTITL